MAKRIWKGNKKRQQKAGRANRLIKRLELIDKLKEQAGGLPGRIAFFILVCYSIGLSKKPNPEEVNEAKKIGPELLSKTINCIRRLSRLSYKGPEKKKQITELKAAMARLQRSLSALNKL